jgi:hypothetical protein
VSFRGAEGDQESAFSLEIRPMQIPRPDESGLGMTTKTSFFTKLLKQGRDPQMGKAIEVVQCARLGFD